MEMPDMELLKEFGVFENGPAGPGYRVDTVKLLEEIKRLRADAAPQPDAPDKRREELDMVRTLIIEAGIVAVASTRNDKLGTALAILDGMLRGDGNV